METPTERKTVSLNTTPTNLYPKSPERLKTSRAPNLSHLPPTNIYANRHTFIPYETPRKHPHPKMPQHFKKSKAPDSSTSTPFSEARNMSIGCPSRFL